MRSRSLAVALFLTLISSNAVALGSYTSGKARSWSDMGEAFAKFHYDMRRGCILQQESNRQTPLFATFIFCDDGSGNYRWAATWNESSEEQALSLARQYLLTSGQCRGQIQQFTVDQWRQAARTNARLSDYVDNPVVARIKKSHEQERIDFSRLVQIHRDRGKSLATGQDLAAWRVEGLKLKEQEEAMLRRHILERQKYGIR